MKPKIKLGLIIGSIGGVLNIIIAAVMGICGPFISLLAGAIAGFLTAQREKAPTKGDGARSGATAGGIAGGLVIIGQLLGTITALVFFQQTGTPLSFGTVPPPNAPAAAQVLYYASGLGVSLCLGLIGAGLAAGAGALAGYFGTPDQPVFTPPRDPNP